MVRRLVHALVIVLTLVIGAAAAVIIVSQTAWFKNWLRAYIVSQAHEYLNGTLSIQRLGGNVFFGLEMENIDVSLDGQRVASVEDIGLDYNVIQLLTRNLSVDNIRLNKPVVYLRREGDTWSLSRLIKKQEAEANRRGPERPVSIDDIGISDGSFIVEGAVGTSGVDVPKRFDHLDAKLSFKYEPVRYSIEITHVSFRGSDPAIALNALSGGVSVREDTVYIDKLALRTAETSLSFAGEVQHYLSTPVFNLEISSDKLSVPELARLLPALAGVQLQPAFNIKLDGPLDRLAVEMNVQSSAGLVAGKIVADVQSPGQSVAGTVSVRHLDVAPLLNAPQQHTDITGDAKIDLRGETLAHADALHGTVRLDSPRLVAAGYVADRVRATARIDGRHVVVDGRGVAYGATATAAGRLDLPKADGALAYDLRGRARHVDLRRLPRQVNAPKAATNVNADYHVTGSGAEWTSLDLRFQESTIAGARIAPGSTAVVTNDRAAIRYETDATVAGLDLQRFGDEFKVPALAPDRFKSVLNGHITARGSGTTADTLGITARGTLDDSTILGGQLPQLTFDTTVAHDAVHAKATGAFADFDPATLTGKSQLGGRVAGTMNVDLTLAHVSSGVTPESVQASGTVNLQPSTIGDLDITSAAIDADYHDSTGEIRALDIAGRDVHVQASGTLALNETGSSNLKMHADSSNLKEIGALFNQPVTGSGTLDATITGNKRELQAKGNFTGDGVKYGKNGALTLSSDYTAKIPELVLEDANITAKSTATFVTIAGHNVNEIEGAATYQQKRVEFNLTAKEPRRTLAATGSVVVHPDHHEVHLQTLGLQTAGLTWQLAPGSEAAIDYADDDIRVRDTKLVSGDQRVSADGAYGKPGDALHVTLENVDLASVDALLLREPQLSGRLSATAVVTAAPETASGENRTPHVKGDFLVTQGGFRDFHYDTFGGTVNYAGRGLTLDTTLQQNATTFITAKGYAPTALFAWRSTADRDAAHSTAAAPEDRVDLHIESTPIDVGLVQGLTPELTNVTGTLQAKIDVTGSAADPHPAGVLTLDKGAFTLPSTGVSYRNVAGKIDLLPDRVHVGAISALDNHFNPITISGDLALHENQIAGVRVFIHTDDFKVIDNKMGNLRVNTDLQIVGELRAPRIEGDLGVTTGSVNLDPILARIADSAYATAPTEFVASAPGPDAPTPGSLDRLKVFDALRMNVHVTIPDDLVIKSTDLQVTGSPVGLGAINVTLGGDVRATKDPQGQIVLAGFVNTIRGTYDFQGRRFDILRDGTVRFTGDSVRDLNPVLDIRTQRTIQAVEARVNIRGTLRQPEIVLASTPPLEEADILSLIVFNQPINTLGEGQQVQLAQRAAQLATGALAGELARSIGAALNVDTFEISTVPDTGLAQLTVGQQLGRNLYVKVQQGIGEQSQTNFVLEYELAKWLRLQTNVMQGSQTQQQLFKRAQGSGVDLLFFFSY